MFEEEALYGHLQDVGVYVVDDGYNADGSGVLTVDGDVLFVVYVDEAVGGVGTTSAASVAAVGLF